jgi:D-alanine-D-alanine ligase
MLDMLDIPYTGSGVMTLAIALDKPMAKRVLAFYGLPTPAFQTFITGNEPLDARLGFPLFVKPSREGSGMGITAKSICRSARELREQVRFIIGAYHQPALVEEYIEGREFTLGLLGNLAWNLSPRQTSVSRVIESEFALAGTVGAVKKSPSASLRQAQGRLLTTRVKSNGNGSARAEKMSPRTQPTLRVFLPLEVDLLPCPEDQAGLYTSVIKSQMYEVPKYLCPAPIAKSMRAKMERFAVGAFTALGCYDFARVDFRIRAETGEPYILEVNPLAGLAEGISDIVMEAEAAGIDYTALINGILDAALQRYGMI